MLIRSPQRKLPPRRVGRHLAHALSAASCLALISCSSSTTPSLAQGDVPSVASLSVAAQTPMPYSEKYRPQFHFSPQSGWMGDPDGLIYKDGLYHLFWWGHAVSRDLVHWSELPWPMLGDDGSFKYYSGSVVVDKDNSAGLGRDSLIAVYTMHQNKDDLETVGLSSSPAHDATDFQYFSGSPVLNTHSKDFRDPQVFWYAPSRRWVMLVALPGERKIAFYASPNLKNWQYLSDFGVAGAQGNSWEVPDLFQLPVDGQTGKTKWVLTIGVSPNRTQYFLGDFDGTRFTLDAATKEFLEQGKGIEGTVFASFDGSTYENWKVTGTAFGIAPSHDTSFRHLGSGFADSFGDSDAATGTLTSPAFPITQKAINFLISGGNHPNKTCINLLVDGKVVRSETGDNTPGLKWKGWDVSDLKGRLAQIQLVDSYTGNDYGHFSVDHIIFSDTLKDDGQEHALWADYGSDFYAARTWRNTQSVNSQTTWIGWLGNWDYANDVPSSWGRGFQSIPRNLSLRTLPEGVRLVQTPLPALESLRQNTVRVGARAIKEGTHSLTEFSPSRNAYEMAAEFAIADPKAIFGFNLLVGDGRKLTLSYDVERGRLVLDRTQTSDFTTNANFTSKFPRVTSAPLRPVGGKVALHIFVDQSSVEIFGGEGQVVLSSLTFPGDAQRGVQLFSRGGSVQLDRLDMWQLKSIWKPDTISVPGAWRADNSKQKSPTYTIQADYAGRYDITAHLVGKSGQVHLEVDGKDISGPLRAPTTENGATVTHRVSLSVGEHQLRLCTDAGDFRVDRVEVATAGSEIISGTTYQLVARHSGRVLDSSGTQEGAVVQQWQPLNGDNQKWIVESAGDGYYKITSQSSHKVLDVADAKDGTPVLQWPWMNNDHQKWKIRDIGGGYYTIRSKAGDKALEVAEFSKSDGGKVQQWQYLGGASQQWKLQKLEAQGQ